MPIILRRSRLSRVLATLLMFTGLVLQPQPVAHSQGNTRVWSRVAGLPVTVHLHDVFMVHERMAWAVGEERGPGVIYRLEVREAGWEVSFETSAPAPLHAVVATDEAHVWAVGDRGIIVRRDAAGWHTLPGAAPEAHLRTIQMFGAGQEGWAAGFFAASAGDEGARPALYRYQDGQWQLEPTVTGPGMIERLHFTAEAGWAVGEGIWRYADGAWTKEEEPFACGENFPCPHSFTAVRAVSADEAWAIGSRHAICAACVTRPYVVHRLNGVWQRVTDVPSGSTNPQSSGEFSGASFSSDGVGLLVGGHDRGIVDPPQGIYDARIRPMIVRYAGQQWNLEALPTDQGALAAVSMIDSAHALAVGSRGLILAYGYGAQPDAGATVGNPNEPGTLYFAPVGHTLRGAFRSYWSVTADCPSSAIR